MISRIKKAAGQEPTATNGNRKPHYVPSPTVSSPVRKVFTATDTQEAA